MDMKVQNAKGILWKSIDQPSIPRKVRDAAYTLMMLADVGEEVVEKAKRRAELHSGLKQAIGRWFCRVGVHRYARGWGQVLSPPGYPIVSCTIHVCKHCGKQVKR